MIPTGLTVRSTENHIPTGYTAYTVFKLSGGKGISTLEYVKSINMPADVLYTKPLGPIGHKSSCTPSSCYHRFGNLSFFFFNFGL